MATTARKTGSGPAPAEPEDLAEDEELSGEEPGRGLTRGVLLAGLAAGVALVTLTYWNGVTPRIPAIPEILGLAAGFVIVMVVFWAVATVVSYLLRWHHRDILSWSYARGKQGVTWGYGHGRRHGGRLWGWLSTWAAARWQARQDGGGEGQDPPSGPGPDEPAVEPAGTGRGSPDEPAAESYSWGLASARHHWPAASRQEAIDRARHASTSGKEYAVCQYPPGGGPGTVIARFARGRALPVEAGTAGEPAATDTGGPDGPGPQAPAGAPAPAATPPKDGAPMPTTTNRPATSRTSGRRVPPVMRAVIAWIDDFEPENDADLHEFLLALAAGLHDVGASLNDLYEMCTSPAVRIGKGGMSATHTAADAIAEASAGVAGASNALAAYYEGVSEEVNAGVELPKDGDFITGDAS